jgi:hypothetical protein
MNPNSSDDAPPTQLPREGDLLVWRSSQELPELITDDHSMSMEMVSGVTVGICMGTVGPMVRLLMNHGLVTWTGFWFDTDRKFASRSYWEVIAPGEPVP